MIRGRVMGFTIRCVFRHLSWVHRHLDLLIALALTVLGQVEVWTGLVVGGPRGPVALAFAAGTMAVAVRRHRPISAVIGAMGALVVQSGLGVDSNTGFAPLLAAFLALGTAGYLVVRRPVIPLVCAVGLAWTGVVLGYAFYRTGSDVAGLIGDLAYAALIIGVAWSVGRGFAVGRLARELSEEHAASAANEERLRIARDVHDVVAHSLSVMSLHAGGARRLLRPDQRDARQALELVEQTARDALAEIRDVLGDLRRFPSGDQPALSRASVDGLLGTVRAAGKTVEVTVDGLPRPVSPAVDLAALRILQESMTNVLRHSDATHVDTRLSYTSGQVEMVITDDGTHRLDATARGHGLAGMQERAAMVGGSLRAGPLPERGFRVTAVLPLTGGAVE
jgi:signal transduction histidine kinase